MQPLPLTPAGAPAASEQLSAHHAGRSLRGFLLTRHRPLSVAAALFAALLTLAAVSLIAEPGPLRSWPTPRELADAIADVQPFWLPYLGLAGVALAVREALRFSSVRWFGRSAELYCSASTFGAPTITRTPQPGTRTVANPLQRAEDVVLLVADAALLEAAVLVGIAVQVPAPYAAALLLAAAPTLLERAAVAAQLLAGLRDRRRDVDEDLGQVRLRSDDVDVRLKPRRERSALRDADELRRAARYN